MRSGKSLFAIFLATLVAQVFPSTRDWFIQTFLNSIANSPNGFYGVAARALTMLAPFQQFMLGVSVGILVALTIGHWDQIRAKAVCLADWLLRSKLLSQKLVYCRND